MIHRAPPPCWCMYVELALSFVKSAKRPGTLAKGHQSPPFKRRGHDALAVAQVRGGLFAEFCRCQDFVLRGRGDQKFHERRGCSSLWEVPEVRRSL